MSFAKERWSLLVSGESTGSVGVVTINMPRIAYLSKSPQEFYRLDRMMDISAKISSH